MNCPFGHTFDSARFIMTLLSGVAVDLATGLGGPISKPSLRLSAARSGCDGKYLNCQPDTSSKRK